MDQVQVIPGPEAEIPGVSKLAVVGGSGTPGNGRRGRQWPWEVHNFFWESFNFMMLFS